MRPGTEKQVFIVDASSPGIFFWLICFLYVPDLTT
jgi:hypothetical protein